MADSPDPPHYPDTGNDTARRPSPTSRAPRWVKVCGVIALVVIVLVLILAIFGGGRHGPARHTSSTDLEGQRPISSVVEGHTPPRGGG
jgi:hypothetical protein